MKPLINKGILRIPNIPINIKKIILITCLITTSTITQANLMITPTRIEFDQRERSAKVSLINTGNETKTYRIFWRQQKQLPDGRYHHFENQDDIGNFATASKMLRYSPRQVTLKPGERQHIRIAARRPKGLADGEYRSHLVFEALANKRQHESKQSEPTGIQLYVNLAFAIPVMVRQGKLDVKASLADVELVTKQVNESTHVGANITINRQGLHSSLGNLKVYWQDIGSSTEKQIGILNNIAIYTEVSDRKITLGLSEHSVKPGTLHIVYEGSNEYKGITFIDQKIAITKSDYHAVTTASPTQ